jgi:hypothetical protein
VTVAHLIVGKDDFTLDDRLIEHLRFVISQKLRRGESFLLTWSYPAEQGSGRRSVWIHEGSVIQFRLPKPQKAPLNTEWLSALLEASHSVKGLNLDEVPQPSSSSASDSGEVEASSSASVGRRS